jgi:transcription initiation factor IIE alpha subunit
MNLFRPSDWFTSSKRINFKKIEENCKKKIKQIINE